METEHRDIPKFDDLSIEQILLRERIGHYNFLDRLKKENNAQYLINIFYKDVIDNSRIYSSRKNFDDLYMAYKRIRYN